MDKGVVLTRIFDAPRRLVFKVWTDPKHMAEWWGPNGFTNSVCELDLRTGGAIRIDMKGPDGTVYPMTGVFREIVAPERIVFTAWCAADETGKTCVETLNTILFAEHNGKTKLTLQAVVVKSTREGAAAIAGMEPGWTQTLERLADYLSKL